MCCALRELLHSWFIDVLYLPLSQSLLSYQIQPKAVEPQAQEHAPRESRDYSSRLSGAISGSIVSIGDVFKDYREGTKAVRFPKDLLKVLEQKLQDIAMGKDPAYVAMSRICIYMLIPNQLL